MKRKFLLSLFTIVCAVAANAQTADEIIAKYFENTGGVDKWKALQGIKFSAKVNQGGMELPLEIVQLKDGRQMTAITFQGKEIKQGVSLSALAKELGVKHFLYSSVAGADLQTGIPHFESKFQIENFIRNTGTPYTILRPASLYENFLIPQVRSRILKGKFVTPLNKGTVQPFIATEDIGKISGEIFRNPEKYIGKVITVASGQMDMQKVARTFSEVLGREIKYEKLPSIITRLAMGKNLFKMFNWLNENKFILDSAIDSTRKEFLDLVSLPEWIEKNFKTQ